MSLREISHTDKETYPKKSLIGNVKISTPDLNYKTEQMHTIRKHTYGCLRGIVSWGDAYDNNLMLAQIPFHIPIM